MRHFYQRARAALNFAGATGDEILLVPQVVYELWAVLTRPIEKNGLGWAPPRAEMAIRDILSRIVMMADLPDLPMHWLAVVSKAGVTGKHAHDWRLAVAGQLAGAAAVLTFNTVDFTGFVGLEVLEPASDPAR